MHKFNRNGLRRVYAVLLTILLLTFLALPVTGQPSPNPANPEPAGPSQWAGAGASWNQFASPQINGMLAYAKRLTSNAYPTYSFTVINILSVQRQPFRVMTTTETGVAQKATSFGPFAIYGLGTMGLATAGTEEGTSTGMVFGGGGMALAGIGKGWTVGPLIRIIKPTIGDRQWAVGVMMGWGQ